jgi:hypothetical protein
LWAVEVSIGFPGRDRGEFARKAKIPIVREPGVNLVLASLERVTAALLLRAMYAYVHGTELRCCSHSGMMA